MEKIEQKFKEIFNKEDKTIFLITIISSMIIHFQLYALMITGPDTLLNSIYHQADAWEAMLLRFGLDFVQMIKGNIVSPILSTLISSIFLGISVILVTKILNIKNKYIKYVITILFVVAPNISATLTFFYCSDAYLLGFLLAITSIYLIKKYKTKNWMTIISGIILAIAMGMYQTYLSVAMVLAVATLIIDILNKKETKQVLKNILKYLIVGIIGIILFYVFAYLTLFLKHLQASTYSGADKIGLSTLLKLPELLPEAYESFFNYYFNDKIIPNTIWLTNIFYIVIFAVTIFSIIYIVIKNKIYKNISNTIIGSALIICLPICFGIIEIVAPSVDIHILMACSMILIFPIFFKIIEILPKARITAICKYTVIICSIIIAWNYMWQDNASYISIKIMQNQAEATANRFVMQVELYDGYTPEMPVIITGGLETSQYFNRDNTTLESKKIFDRTWGFISSNPTMWWGNQESWKKMIYEYIGANLNIVNQSDYPEIIESEEYKQMGNYPEEESIKIIDNVLVIKIS